MPSALLFPSSDSSIALSESTVLLKLQSGSWHPTGISKSTSTVPPAGIPGSACHLEHHDIHVLKGIIYKLGKLVVVYPSLPKKYPSRLF